MVAEPLRWRIGDVRVTRVVELTSASIGNYILPQASAERLAAAAWLKPFVDAEGRLVMSFHSLVIESAGQTIVVDTCIGNDKVRGYPRWNRMQSSFLADFAEAGFDPARVDSVLCTHMHVDHVGWNTRLVDGRWQPTFAAARYLYAEDEWEHWRQEPADDTGPIIEDSVQPIFDAGLADLVPGDAAVNNEVRLEPTPGHTPGHVSVHIASKGEEAVITGDMIHHPCQIAHPDWSTTADTDQAWAAATRQTFLDRYADRPVLIIGTHFAGPTAGRIVRDGDAFRLDA
jgi:glyoxylase-like metal-dependent hydrolase (beta-lactamase superfamily II)